VSVARGECQEAGEGALNNTVIGPGKHRKVTLCRVNAYDIKDSTYSVRNAQVLERDPYPLHKGTEAASEKGDIRIPRMWVDGIEGFTSTLEMILFSGIGGKRHDQGDQAFREMVKKSLNSFISRTSYGCQKWKVGRHSS
jgi:hypothetical protein